MKPSNHPETPPEPTASEPALWLAHASGTPMWRPFYPHDNRFVYLQVSERANGMTLGVNLNPDKNCNFTCVYCEVDRSPNPAVPDLDVPVMARELRETLSLIRSGQIRELAGCRHLPDQLLRLRHVALSGEGEPTLSPKFVEALEAVIHVRAWAGLPFFKLVLSTNATGLDSPEINAALRHLVESDEIWAKLDGGTQAYVNRINRAEVPLSKILSNILALGRQRAVIIQTLFPAINGEGPSLEEIDQYSQRLLELKESGAQIPLVQIFSSRPTDAHPEIGHIPLKALSRIAATVHRVTGLKVEVF